MPRILAVGLLSLGMTGTCLAQEAVQVEKEGADGPYGEIALSDDTLQLRFVDDGDRGAGSRLTGGFFLSEERDIVLTAGMIFPAGFDDNRLQINFGPRAYAALLEEENEDVMAVSLGGEIRFEMDTDSGFAVVGEAYYAPDILTFGAANNLTDLSARLEVMLQQRLTLFGGFRWFEFDLAEAEDTRTLQEEFFVGVGWRFD